MRFLPRVSVRKTGQPAGPASSRAILHVHCDQHAQIKVRALCVLALTTPSARLLSLHADQHDAATAHLRLEIALDDPGTVPLDRLVDQLSREPGVRDLHWHQHPEPNPQTCKTQWTRRPSHAHHCGT
ncbi:hypothetical protein ACFYMW_37290 [Streptomyces sp. NPDC006692]|uniref:hypothetical protein n=1 Tax=unclassified Streptomyces TaxID=2593676 RepID=UPI00343F5A09